MESSIHSVLRTLTGRRSRILGLTRVGLAAAAAFAIAWPASAPRATLAEDELGAPIFLPVAVSHFSGPFDPPTVAPPTPDLPTDEPTPEPSETPPPTPRPQPSPTKPTGPDWLIYFNQRRELAKLPPVTEDPIFSRGDALHAKYMVKNDYIGHTEDPRKPHYTAEGLAAAQNGDVAVHSRVGWSHQGPINLWMTGPFHLLPLISPFLRTTGFGLYSEADGGFQSGAAMEWQRGRAESVPSTVSFPIRFPENGTVMPFLSHDGGESPNPLTSCPGYAAPVGAPIVLQLGIGDSPPKVTKTSLISDNKALVHCWFDETSYKNADANSQRIGRSVLGMANAVIILAKQPLKPDAAYSVSITTGGTTYEWSFRTATEAARPLMGVDPEGMRAWMKLPR